MPASAISRATWATRRMFSVRSAGENAEVAREAVAQVVAVEEVRGVAGLDQERSSAAAIVDLPEAGQAGEPDRRAARAERGPAVAALEPGLVPGDAGRVRLLRGRASRHAPHHAGGDGVVGVLVDRG